MQLLQSFDVSTKWTDLTGYCPASLSLVFGDSNLGKVRQIKPAQLAFRCTINIMLLTYIVFVSSSHHLRAWLGNSAEYCLRCTSQKHHVWHMSYERTAWHSLEVHPMSWLWLVSRLLHDQEAWLVARLHQIRHQHLRRVKTRRISAATLLFQSSQVKSSQWWSSENLLT